MGYFQKLLFILFVGIFSLTQTWAQTSSTTTDTAQPEATTTQQPVKSKRMRALMGSTSRWSAKFNLIYYGSSVSHPFASEAPNPDHDPDPPQVNMKGKFGVNYRLAPATSLFFGTGLQSIRPLEGFGETHIDDLHGAVNRTGSFGNWEHLLQLSGTWYTRPNARKIGKHHSVALAEDLAYRWPETRLTTGAAAEATYISFDKPESKKQMDGEFVFGIYGEYTLSDKWILRSDASLWTIQHMRIRPLRTWKTNKINQTVSVAYALASDIYFQPFISFYPENIEMETTSFNMRFIFSVL